MRQTLAPADRQHPLLRDHAAGLRAAADRLLNSTRIRLDRLWAYYRNPLRIEPQLATDTAAAQRPYRQAQEWGLPPRITGVVSGTNVFDGASLPGVSRKEVVIENDIGWRIETQVDFLFGRPIVLNSASPDDNRRPQIESLLRQILAANGGLVFLQKLALLGAVYGQVDVLVKFTPDDADTAPDNAAPTQQLGSTDPAAVSADGTPPPPGPPDAGPALDAPAPQAAAPGDDPAPKPGATPTSQESLERLARTIRFEIVDPTRALPLLDATDCRRADAFAVVYQLDRNPNQPTVKPAKWWQTPFSRPAFPQNAKRTIIELITEYEWTTFDDGTIIAGGDNTLGRLPLVHIQNTADPLRYDGVSDVEPLIPLQDELNTRLSDRAHRIALQSFKMYLGKGIENFTEFGVSPGRMWTSDNPDADIVELGGDANCPSEDVHIAEIREALDKISGVSPVASSAIKGKIGNLTSAEALRVTMMALLSRTERKRITYGTAISQLCELALAWIDHAGLFTTTDADRAVQIHWPSPMPSNEAEQLALAKAKQSLGVPRDVVLRELGYADAPIPSPGTPGEG
ncbi:MAG: phage portal protein [Tepidisphaeraceae bacterium]